MPDPTTEIPNDELALRVIYALARPAVRIAAVFGLPLKSVLALVEAAYFQEVRSTRGTLEEAADALGVSRRTASRLARQLRERFVVPEVAHNLPRRVEFMLAATPMSEARLLQVMADDESDQVAAALQRLLDEGRVEAVKGRTTTYRPAHRLSALPRDTWVRRVGGLTSFAENLADAAYGRFFEQEPRTFARTLSFRMPAGGRERLERLYSERVLPEVIGLDEETEGDGTARSMQLSLCWAPYEFIRTAGAVDEEER